MCWKYEKPEAGKKYNKLTVFREIEHRSSNGERMYYCVCECGRSCLAKSYELVTYLRKSCGNCLGTRSMSGGSIYWCFMNMMARCNNPNHPQYKDYGGRGIGVAEEWSNTSDGFLNFVTWAHNNGYVPGLSLDRIDNDQGYSSSNCRWVPRTIQNINRRYKPSNTGLIGVHQDLRYRNSFRATISINNKTVYLGSRNTAVEAAKLRNEFIKENELPHKLNDIE